MKREFASVPMPENRAQARGGLTYEEKRHMLRDWVYENCCKGRQMKTPVPRGRDYDVKWAEPNCFGGDNYPARARDIKNPYSVAPSILITGVSFKPYAETSEYLDSRQKVSRPKNVGSTITLNLIHAVYDPGERMTVRQKENAQGEPIQDGDPHEMLLTDEAMDTGSMILWQWMEDTASAIHAALSIAGMTVKDDSIIIEPLTENESVSDRRPVYFGVVQVTLIGLNREMQSPELSALLD